MMKHLIWATIVAGLSLSASVAVANHEPAGTNENEEAAVLLSSTSTTTTAVVGAIILTVMMNSDADTFQNYLQANAVALQTDLSLGAGPTVDDLALAFGVRDEHRPAFGKVLRAHRADLLELAQPDRLNLERTKQFIGLVAASCQDAGILDANVFSKG